MKKILAFSLFTACGNSKAPATDQVENEPIDTEEVADLSVVDTTAVPRVWNRK